jgi:diguanylate cyclase (GGDEF)-like protein
MNIGHTASHSFICPVRSDDAAARIGGDEFFVVLTGTHSLDEAVAVAEEIRNAAAVSVSVDHAQVVTSLSIGVALVR